MATSASAAAKLAEKGSRQTPQKYFEPKLKDRGVTIDRDKVKESQRSLSAIFRFRTQDMKSIAPPQAYKLFQAEFPVSPDSPYYTPEIWGRLLKAAFKRNDSPTLRLIANNALKWCQDEGVQQRFPGASSTSAFAPGRPNPGVGPLPHTAKTLELLVTSLVHADDARLQKTEARVQLIADSVKESPSQVSIRSMKKRAQELKRIASKTDPETAPDAIRTLAERFAWTAELKRPSLLQVPKPNVKAISLDDVSDNRVVRLFKSVRQRKQLEKRTKEQKDLERRERKRNLRQQKHAMESGAQSEAEVVDTEVLEEPTWDSTSQLLGRAQRLYGRSDWHTTLKRFAAWARTAKDWDPDALDRYVEFLENVKSSDTKRGTSNDAGMDFNREELLKSAFSVAKGTKRPPTYLLLASLRHVSTAGQPKLALSLACQYLDSLLADVKSGNVAKNAFSAHPACTEVEELSEHVDVRKRRPLRPLFLRTEGPTYSITSMLQPPRGDEILNAVLRAYLRAGASLQDMISAFRRLSGSRVRRFIRAWESERRLELARLRREHSNNLQMRQLPLGFLREYEASARAQWLIDRGPATEHEEKIMERGRKVREMVDLRLLPPPPPFKDPVTPEQARTLSAAQIDVGSRMKETEIILCYPNEETFSILLEAVRKQTPYAVPDGISFINKAMATWGPPPVQPLKVPSNLNPLILRYKPQTREGDESNRIYTADPYLNITTHTLRKLLRWAIWAKHESGGHRVMRAGEAWIRHSREWKAACANIPVIAYDPTFHIAEADADNWLKEHYKLPVYRVFPSETNLAKQPLASDLRYINWLRHLRARRTYYPGMIHIKFADIRSRDNSVGPGTGVTTWMKLDGGHGYLAPGVSGKERSAWYRVLIRARDVLPAPQQRSATASSDQADGTSGQADREGASSDAEPDGHAGAGAAAAAEGTDGAMYEAKQVKDGDGTPYTRTIWLTRQQAAVAMGASARALLLGYEQLYVDFMDSPARRGGLAVPVDAGSAAQSGLDGDDGYDRWARTDEEDAERERELEQGRDWNWERTSREELFAELTPAERPGERAVRFWQEENHPKRLLPPRLGTAEDTADEDPDKPPAPWIVRGRQSRDG